MDIDKMEEEMLLLHVRAPLTHHPLHPLTSDLIDGTFGDSSNGSSSGIIDNERDAESRYACVAWSQQTCRIRLVYSALLHHTNTVPPA
jgi:hypothetical protein